MQTILTNIEDESLITKANSLIEARYKLTTNELKIISILISLCKDDDTDFNTYSFRVKDFVKALELKNNSKHGEIKTIIKKLMEKVFYIKGQNEDLCISWLSSANYIV